LKAVRVASGETALEFFDITASDIDIVDSGGYFTATEVEAALQELAPRVGIIPVTMNGLLAQVPASTTWNLLPNTTEFGATNYNAVFPKGGTLSDLSLLTNSAQPGGGSMVVTLYVNGSSTVITFTISAGAAAGNFSDNTHTVTINDGDRVRIVFVNNDGGSSSAQVGATSFLLTY